MEDLSALESVQEITDFLQIQADVDGFHDLSFLRNLRIIHGRVTDRFVARRSLSSVPLCGVTMRWLGGANVTLIPPSYS